jgi:NAD(P)-dependent dehydrogenase (short-subunit alcohol dehydrogenase family)
MKIVVIGGTGLIGSRTVAILRQGGHEAVAASPRVGVNTVTGEGLKEAIADARVVIDLSNAPSRDTKSVLEMQQLISRRPGVLSTRVGFGRSSKAMRWTSRAAWNGSTARRERFGATNTRSLSRRCQANLSVLVQWRQLSDCSRAERS